MKKAVVVTMSFCRYWIEEAPMLFSGILVAGTGILCFPVVMVLGLANLAIESLILFIAGLGVMLFHYFFVSLADLIESVAGLLRFLIESRKRRQ